MIVGRVAIVTASGKGMGEAIAKELSTSGCSLVLMSPSGTAGELANSLGALGSRASATEVGDLQKRFAFFSRPKLVTSRDKISASTVGLLVRFNFSNTKNTMGTKA